MSGVYMSLDPMPFRCFFCEDWFGPHFTAPICREAICVDCVAAYDIDFLWRVFTFWVLKKQSFQRHWRLTEHPNWGTRYQYSTIRDMMQAWLPTIGARTLLDNSEF